METTKTLYSIFIPAWRIEQAKQLFEEFITNQQIMDIQIEGIDECYMKSYKNRDKTICEVCISSKNLKTFDDLWHSSLGKLLRNQLGYTLHQVQRGVYGIYKRPDTYKFKTINERLPKRKVLVF